MFNCHSGRRTTYILFSMLCPGWKTIVIVRQVACLYVATCVICGWEQLSCCPIEALILRQSYSADKFALTISFIPRSIMSKYEYWYLQHLSISLPRSVKMWGGGAESISHLHNACKYGYKSVGRGLIDFSEFYHFREVTVWVHKCIMTFAYRLSSSYT